MPEFATSGSVVIEIDQSSLRDARREVEDSIGSVQVDVDGGGMGGGGGVGGGTGMVGTLEEGLSLDEERNELLVDIFDVLDESAPGFGGGGGPGGDDGDGGIPFGAGAALGGGGLLGGLGGSLFTLFQRASRLDLTDPSELVLGETDRFPEVEQPPGPSPGEQRAIERLEQTQPQPTGMEQDLVRPTRGPNTFIQSVEDAIDTAVQTAQSGVEGTLDLLTGGGMNQPLVRGQDPRAPPGVQQATRAMGPGGRFNQQGEQTSFGIDVGGIEMTIDDVSNVRDEVETAVDRMARSVKQDIFDELANNQRTAQRFSENLLTQFQSTF